MTGSAAVEAVANSENTLPVAAAVDGAKKEKNATGPYEVLFCTGNKNKLMELRQLVKGVPDVTFDSISIDLPEIQGDPQTVTTDKCRKAFAILKRPVIVEDVSLGFNALGGLPGAYIRDFLERLKPSGLHNLLKGYDDKTGFALCTVAFWDGSADGPILFEGRTDGTIVAPRGSNAFGWDPIFEPKGHDKTFGEMSNEMKNSLSHRYKAVMKLKEYLAKELPTLRVAAAAKPKESAQNDSTPRNDTPSRKRLSAEGDKGETAPPPAKAARVDSKA